MHHRPTLRWSPKTALDLHHPDEGAFEDLMKKWTNSTSRTPRSGSHLFHNQSHLLTHYPDYAKVGVMIKVNDNTWVHDWAWLMWMYLKYKPWCFEGPVSSSFQSDQYWAPSWCCSGNSSWSFFWRRDPCSPSFPHSLPHFLSPYFPLPHFSLMAKLTVGSLVLHW